LYRQVRGRRQHLRNTIRPALGVADTDLVVLTVGKVSERKRTGDILDGAALLKSLDPANRIRFIVAGDGTDLAAIKMRAEAEDLPVTFLGFVNVDQLSEVYAANVRTDTVDSAFHTGRASLIFPAGSYNCYRGATTKCYPNASAKLTTLAIATRLLPHLQ
jgi:glycosyltransferase involved in cell wall biosynthesis